MAAVTICSDFGAQKNKVSHCFHCFPIYSHEMMGPDALTIGQTQLEASCHRSMETTACRNQFLRHRTGEGGKGMNLRTHRPGTNMYYYPHFIEQVMELSKSY